LGIYVLQYLRYSNFNKIILSLFALANKAFSKPMEPFHRIGISKEEFSLILAIVYLNPCILIM